MGPLVLRVAGAKMAPVAFATFLMILNVHRGAALPAARVIVVAVPVTIGFLYWYLIVRRRGGSR